MSTTPSAKEQIEELEQQIEKLKHRSILQLRVQLAEARNAVTELEIQIQKLTGKAPEAVKSTGRKPRTSVNIDDVVQAIKGGATNYRAVAQKLGSTAATVTKKIKAEGKAAGISSTGQKATFKLTAK
ncbi:MAG: hypothetical protein WCP06_00580 [Verrucomicrobiota bacterium]